MQKDAIDLLALYRRLCEAVGSARANGVELPREAQERLARIEIALRARLAAAPAMQDGSQPEEKTAPSPSATATVSERPPRATTTITEGTGSRPTSRKGEVFSDGACLGNPGPGGYGAIVRVPGHSEQELRGSAPQTTNNKMELTGALVGLRKAVELGATEISVQSDSEYLIKGMTQWVKGWQRNGWKTGAKEPVKNRDLWEELVAVCQGRAVTWHWTKGHAGNRENERCDSMALSAAKSEAGRLRW